MEAVRDGTGLTDHWKLTAKALGSIQALGSGVEGQRNLEVKRQQKA